MFPMLVKFLSKIDVDNKFYSDPLLIQIVCRHLFDSLLKKEIPVCSLSPAEIPDISCDELNAIRYAAGYVIVSVRRKLRLAKSDIPTNKALIDFLNTLHVDDNNSDETMLEYTTRWINKVNRGGLFIIGDKVFETFCAMEMVQRTFLKDLGNPLHHKIDIDAIEKELIEDVDVQFWWALVCACLDNDLTELLLKKIVKLWVTLRGFAYANAIVEQYKECTKTALKRKHALRKDLKSKSAKND